MKFNFIEKRKQEKEDAKRQKEEAARIKAEQERIKREEEERKKKQEEKKSLILLAAVVFIALGCLGISKLVNKETPVEEAYVSEPIVTESVSATELAETISLSDIPAYSSSPYIAINGNIPFFQDSDLTTTSFETYSDLDSLGRCGVAYANVSKDTMPTEERGNIGQVKPSGWHIAKYDFVDGKYLYNRCHLIGYQLTAENANDKNLITGTRYLNVEGMLPFENMVADYIKETNNHVLYRVTPVFDGDDLVATGVLMEAKSVEDDGKSVCFNVFCYNVQPGVVIDYSTGDSELDSKSGVSASPIITKAPTSSSSTTPVSQPVQAPVVQTSAPVTPSSQTYILNTNTRKFHNPSCSSVSKISAANKQEFTGSRADLIAQGYEPCKRCNP